MARMNGTGPEGKGTKTGRGLGRCKKELSQEELPQKSGIGMGKGKGKRRKSGGGEGRGRRSKYGN